MRTILIAISIIFLFVGCSNSKGIPEERAKIPQGFKATLIKNFDFEDTPIGKLPIGWSSHFTGRGKLGIWQVISDSGNKVLAQLSLENHGYHFNLAIYDELKLKDLEITLDFKGVKGREDQGGGPVWRYQDENNYYVARANPLEDNFRVYRVVNGERQQMASARVKVPSNQWHKIKVRMIGDHIECFYNGLKFLDVHDSTFKKAGKIGLWTKADAYTYFDNVKISKIQQEKK